MGNTLAAVRAEAGCAADQLEAATALLRQRGEFTFTDVEEAEMRNSRKQEERPGSGNPVPPDHRRAPKPAARPWSRLALTIALLAGLCVTTIAAPIRAEVASSNGARGAVAVSDDSSRRVVLTEPARRVVSLSPALTELVFAAGGGARLAGVVEHSDFPAPARDLPRVGDALALPVERILALRPDLILAWRTGNNPRQLERLEQLGIPIYYSEVRSLDQVATTLERLGVLLGTSTEAAAAAAAFRSRLAKLGPSGGPGTPASSTPAPVRVFYQVWARPLMTINGRHVISDLIERCGGVNVFAAASVLVPQVGVEAVVAAAPEVVFAAGNGSSRHDDASLDHWRRFPGIPAVARGFLFFVDDDAISRATPRMLEAGEAICAQLARVRGAR